MNLTLDAGSLRYWFGKHHYYSFDSEQKFLDYFFLPLTPKLNTSNYEYIVKCHNSSDHVYDPSTKYIFLSIENCPAHGHYSHYNTYNNYGNSNISIYLYNHIDRIEETSSYIAIPVIYCQMYYFTKMYKSIVPSKRVEFKDKHFCIVLSTNTFRKSVKTAICEFLSTIGQYDTIDTYKPLIGNSSCYHSDELLNVIQGYKFAFVCENSVADGYITEKIFNCLFAGTIPIYNGSLKIDSYINKNSFINANYLDTLYSRTEEIRTLMTDESAFNQKINATVSENYDDEGFVQKLGAFVNAPVKVSVVISTYNRFTYILNAIDSVKRQTYPNIEIIVVNDASTQKEYYEYDFPGVKILHMEKNSRTIFGFPCAGYVRNQGIHVATGKYVAFCDDDDIWFPNKIELQVQAMERTGCKMSSTEGLIGKGIYTETSTYKLYNSQHYYETLKGIYTSKGSRLLDNGFPERWSLEFIKVHNCVITSSVCIDKQLMIKIGKFSNVKNGCEDYGCWLRALEHTDSVYVNDVCFYYDLGHGDGQQY